MVSLMLKFIEMEFFKLKNSKVFLLILLGSIAPAFLVHFGFSGRIDYGEKITFALLSGQTNLYMLAIFGLFLTTIVVSYMFSREFNEHTLKSILPTPISRSKYLIGKSAAFLIWILILCSVCFFSPVIFSYITGVEGISANLILKYYGEMLIGGVLLFMVMTPIMFISMLMKSMVPAMICAATLSLGNLFAYGHDPAVFYPWILPAIVSSGEIVEYTSNISMVYGLIAITFIAGLGLTYYHLTQKDIRL